MSKPMLWYSEKNKKFRKSISKSLLSEPHRYIDRYFENVEHIACIGRLIVGGETCSTAIIPFPIDKAITIWIVWRTEIHKCTLRIQYEQVVYI